MFVDFSLSLSGFEPVPDAHASGLWPQAHPYLLAHGSKPRAIVLGLHGYRATPNEIRPVLQACHGAGMDAVSLLFAGHGFAEPRVQRAAIRQMYPRALQEAAKLEVARCRAQGYERVYVYGHSMGGAVALQVAAEAGADAVAVTAPALRLPLRAWVLRLVPALFDISVPHASSVEEDGYRYAFDTTWAMGYLFGIAAHARAALPGLRCPTFVAQSRADETIPQGVGDLIEREADCAVTRRWFEESGHSMPRGSEAAAVAAAVAEFLAAQP